MAELLDNRKRKFFSYLLETEPMLTEDKLRLYIRKFLQESINNFLDKEPATATKQLKDTSKSQVLGDPISDVELNQMADDQGSDGTNAPTVSVKAGATKGGNGPETGQKKVAFSDKTKQTK
ncbi:MAG: hypothetical protein ACJ77K_03335 [Bacteroidia bacterium]|jgi:hypothetical protein